ncbi:glycoside hydrolase superfamily [Flammula alnicola]|nr:glycoside hydrolase superfamily [Flammula alnicola]
MPVISPRTITNEVQYDSYSLILRGQRVFIYSGEFHTFRLPVPSLWPDILQKIKAAGFNAISVYTHMGQINPSRGVVDFNGYRALQPLFDAAKESGPYINGETSVGGVSHWITTEIAGQPRSNDTDYTAAWKDYIAGIIKVTAPNQISSGGSVIDNEFSQSPAFHAAYFIELEDVYHNSPIDVPLTYNDPGMGSSFINGTGAVDLYGFDEYPQQYDCTHQTWNPVPTNYYSYHAQVNSSKPQFIPGIMQKMINFYIFYGGTSWGAIPYPGIYTSYDYGATIAESRQLTTKFNEMKRQGLFLRSSPEFYKTDWVADTNTELAISTNSASYITELRNPDTQAGFFVARQANSTSISTITFKLNVTSSAGALQIPLVAPAITIGGRQSKVIMTDYSFGSSSKAMYSTAQVFFSGVINGRDVLFLHGDTNQTHETALTLTGTLNKIKQLPLVTLSRNQSGLPHSTTVVSFMAGINGLVTVWDSDNQLVLRHLVWNASILGSTFALRGDLQAAVQLTVIAPRSVRTITWNGARVPIDNAASSTITSRGGFVGQLALKLSLSNIQATYLPEIQKGFDDSSWTVVNHTTMNIPYPPYYSDGRILYGCDYGFCENMVLWRGHFMATGQEKSVHLSVNGGQNFAASVWLNNIFLNSYTVSNTEEFNQMFDNMGLDENGYNPLNVLKSPRGIRGFQLDTGRTFTEWKVQGKVGGYKNFPDKVRGVLNEGGLFGEWKGWHLPSFSTIGWESRPMSSGLPNGAGVGFFVMTFDLNIQGIDAMMSFTACLFVNGWMMGKRVAKFPVHEGILNYHGKNTVAVAIWSLMNTTISPGLELILDAAVEGGVGNVVTDNRVWSPVG